MLPPSRCHRRVHREFFVESKPDVSSFRTTIVLKMSCFSTLAAIFSVADSSFRGRDKGSGPNRSKGLSMEFGGSIEDGRPLCLLSKVEDKGVPTDKGAALSKQGRLFSSPEVPSPAMAGLGLCLA